MTILIISRHSRHWICRTTPLEMKECVILLKRWRSTTYEKKRKELLAFVIWSFHCLSTDTHNTRSSLDEDWWRSLSVPRRCAEEQSSERMFYFDVLLNWRLSCSQTLKEIDLGSNKTGRTGVEHLVDALTMNRVRQEFPLYRSCHFHNQCGRRWPHFAFGRISSAQKESSIW
jgi:hypothetical protein